MVFIDAVDIEIVGIEIVGAEIREVEVMEGLFFCIWIRSLLPFVCAVFVRSRPRIVGLVSVGECAPTWWFVGLLITFWPEGHWICVGF